MISVDGADLAVRLEGEDDATVAVPANEMLSQRVYLEAAPGTPAAEGDRTDVTIWVASPDGTTRVQAGTVFNGKAH